MRTLIVVERGEEGWGGHVPDLPGCIAAATTRDEALRLIRGAIASRIAGLHQIGEPAPSPSSEGEVIEVDAG